MIKTAVILAAGFGSRSGLFEKPKGFLNIAGKPLIEYSIQALLAYGIERIFVVTGFKSIFYENLAARYRQIITCKNDYFLETGSLKSLYCLADLINEDILLLESDLLYDEHCLGKLLELPCANAILLGQSTNQRDGVWVQVDPERFLVKMSKDRQSLADPLDGILVGITKMSYPAFRQLAQKAPDILRANPHQHYDFVFEQLQEKFFAYELANLHFTEIDDDEQLSFAVNCIYPKLTFRYPQEAQGACQTFKKVCRFKSSIRVN